MNINDRLFDDMDGIYNYCPSIIKQANQLYVYYCSNRLPFIIIDHVALRVMNLVSGEWTDKKFVLAPSASGWDSVHTCDPSVVQCDIMIDNKHYSYVMAYLGCDTLDCTHNQVGLAFAHALDEEFVKYSHNPIVPYEGADAYRLWGTGQPSIVCLNKRDEFLLSYTMKTRQEGTFTNLRKIRITNEGIITLWEKKLSTLGLKLHSSRDTIHNIDLAYAHDRLFMVRDTISEADNKYPNFIGSVLEVASIDMELTSPWTHIYAITIRETHSLRNHNAGIVRGPFGELLDDMPRIIYTNSIEGTSNEDLKYLWSYRLHYYRH